jgi:hypothetical protein
MPTLPGAETSRRVRPDRLSRQFDQPLGQRDRVGWRQYTSQDDQQAWPRPPQAAFQPADRRPVAARFERDLAPGHPNRQPGCTQRSTQSSG